MGTITKEYTFVDGTPARPEQMNANFDVIVAVINSNLDWDNLDEDALKNQAGGLVKLDESADVPLGQIPDTLTGKDADTVDTKHYSDITTKITADIATHKAIAAAHHAKTVYADVSADVDAAIAAAGGDVTTAIAIHAAIAAAHHAKTVSSDIDHGSVGGLSDNDHPQYVRTALLEGCRVRLTSNQSIPGDSGYHKVNLSGEDWDVGSNFSGGRFTLPVNGRYLVCAYTNWTSVAGYRWGVAIYKNGVSQAGFIAQSDQSNHISAAVTDVVRGTAGQYIEMYAAHSYSSARDLTGDATLSCTHMTVQLLCPD